MENECFQIVVALEASDNSSSEVGFGLLVSEIDVRYTAGMEVRWPPCDDSSPCSELYTSTDTKRMLV